MALVGGVPDDDVTPPRTAAEDIAINAAWGRGFAGGSRIHGYPAIGIIQNPYLTHLLDIYVTFA